MLSALDHLVVLIYLLLVLAIGFWFQRRASGSLEAYFLGNRGMPWWALGASGMASNTDIAGTMVIAGLVYALGVKGFFVEIRGGIVLVMAFFMIFMGKWLRRSQVMTLAEWMTLRFGTGREGRLARTIAALSNLIVSVWLISYFAVGGGKFLGELMAIDYRLASIGLIGFALIYTLLSGFYGVVWTDLLQGGLIFVAIVFIAGLALTKGAIPEQFSVALPSLDGGFAQSQVQYSEWSQISLPASVDYAGSYSAFNLFALTILFYLFKTSLEGFAGAGGYMSQRFLAARSDREAGLLSLFWIVLLACRWPLIGGLVVLAIDYTTNVGVITDPELVLPTVLANYLPSGIKGIFVACFIAAAMSTFDSIINASGAYWVKDLYQQYINPHASEKQLLFQGKIASLLVVVGGVLLSFPIVNINDIWGWLTMAFGTGLFIPLFMRWYWWRFNGYGFAVGSVLGMVGAVLLRVLGIELPEYANFLVPAGLSFLGCVVGSLVTPPTSPEVLELFFRTTRPFGFWKPARAALSRREQAAVRLENKRDLIAVCFAVPWQLSLFLAGLCVMLGRWDQVTLLSAVFVLCSLGLWFFWYRHLSQQSFVSAPLVEESGSSAEPGLGAVATRVAGAARPS